MGCNSLYTHIDLNSYPRDEEFCFSMPSLLDGDCLSYKLKYLYYSNNHILSDIIPDHMNIIH